MTVGRKTMPERLALKRLARITAMIQAVTAHITAARRILMLKLGIRQQLAGQTTVVTAVTAVRAVQQAQMIVRGIL